MIEIFEKVNIIVLTFCSKWCIVILHLCYNKITKGAIMPRFFVPVEDITDGEIRITSGDAAHISRVLRLREGDTVTVCDGRGFDYNAEIAEINAGEIICSVTAKRRSESEPDVFVTLYQGLPKASKMDYIIQKTTELGVSKIVPVAMARCVSRIEDKKTEAKKLERWNKIAKEAAQQSQRGIVPEICPVMTFDEAAAAMAESDLCFAPYECEDEGGLKNTLLSVENPKTVSFMIGPEGGFDLSEIEKLKAAQIPTVTLGPRILRTETAGEAVLAMMMYEIGDVNG